MKVVRESLYESYDEIERTDEGWKEIKGAVTKPFRKRTPEEVEATAMKIISDTTKLQKIIDVLKASKTPVHFDNFLKAKKQYDAGDKGKFYNFICFVLDNWGDFKAGNPIYYAGTAAGGIEDTTQRSYSPGVGGRTRY